jgi:DNA ligase-1
MKLPTLYSRTATGAIQTWCIEVEQDKYRTVFGQQGGAIQTTNWTGCYPTNEGRANARDGIQQALFEAQALWKKKKDSGCFEDINDVDNMLFVEPMLAKNYEDYKDSIKFPVFSQPKLDGIRCIVTKDGMFTRNGKSIESCPHIFKEIQKFFIKDQTLVFDGELYNHDLKHDFNKITSLVKKTKPTIQDIKESSQLVQYWIYDIVDTTKTFKERMEWIEQNVLGKCDFTLKAVSTALPTTQQELDDLYAAYTEHGFEGQMIRLNTKYENKRSKNLLKRKDFQDREYVIVNTIEGEGNKQGMLGAFVLKNDNGLTFNSNIKGTREYLQELWATKETLPGKLATVKYFNLTPVNEDGTGGVPRFPYVIKIREDFDV